MKAQLKKRPQSSNIRTKSGSTTRRVNPAQGEEYFKKGKVEQLAGNHKRAIELYTIATACKASYFQAYCNMGYCYRALGKFSAAKRSYQSALFSNPQDPITHFNFANLYRVMGENQQAIEQYSQVIALKQQGSNVGSLYVDSLVNIGICYKNRGEIGEAIKVNRKVLQIQPNQAGATFNLAICLLNSIQDKNTPFFHKFYHQRATQAEGLFQNVLRKDPDSIMAQFCLNKVSAILDPSYTNLELVIVKQKELLSSSRCNIQDEINQEIARCLSLQKKYGQSARYYESSMGARSRKTSPSKYAQNKIEEIFETFSHQKILQNQDFLTEAEGVALIENGSLKKADQKISKLPDGLLKQTLQLILELKKSEEEPSNTGNAFAIYQLYFNKGQKELPFDKISIQAHKAIGKVLSLQQNYEESIKHYEYISQNIKNNRSNASAKLHTQLGECFQQVGNRQKALEQYKKGMQIQPDNYSLSYSMGYCLYENGSYQQAKTCFDKIIQRISADNSLAEQTKQLYLTDCMIICALCTTQNSLATFNLFTDAFKQLQKLQSSKEGSIQMEEENLLLFFIRILQLYEQKIVQTTPDDPRYKESANMLIAIYQEILELNCCPDRNQTLINCGNLSYQLSNYATAAVTYSQVTNPHMIPALNLALTYAHLIEPSLALKYAQQACQMEGRDAMTNFCREVLQWIYFNAHDGEWNKHLPNYKQDLFYERNQYGMGIIDKLSESINSPDYQPKGLQKLLQSLAKHQESIKSKSPIINHKFQILQELQKRYDFQGQKPSGSMLSTQILKLCFGKSGNLNGDFTKLVQLLEGIPKSGQESYYIEAAIYLFIFSNQTDNQHIHQILRKMAQNKKQYGIINSPSVKQNSNIYSIYPDFKTVKELITVLRQWETVLEPSTRETMHILEDIYYKGNIRQPFEIQYHFPRNLNLLEEDETFQKVISIVLNVIKYNKNLICRGNNIKQLRKDLIKDFEAHFIRFLKINNLHPLSISQSFLPATLFAVHERKQDCQQFLNEVTKRFKVPQIQLQDCEQVIIVINKLIKLRCKWNNPYEISSILHQVIDNIVENPLFIVNQAIIYLQSIIPVLKKDSAQAKKYISQSSTLNF